MAHKKHTVSEEDAGIRLDRWFKRNRPDFTQSLLQKFLRKKDIKVNGKRATTNYRIEEGDVIFVLEIANQDSDKKAKVKNPDTITRDTIRDFQSWVLFESNDFLVINKPQGMASQGGSGITVSIDSIIRAISPRYKLVHRLDKDTSGALVIAKKTTAASKFSELMHDKKIEKTYIALVKGVPKPKQGKINAPLLKKGTVEKMQVDENGKAALTEYKVLENLGQSMALVELKPITGRTHQLRVHMAFLGHPIIGDGKYGGREAFEEGLGKTLHLHAKHIFIPELDIDIVAKPPKHFDEVL